MQYILPVVPMHRHPFLLIFLALPFLFSCEQDTRSQADRVFEEFSERFLEQYFSRFPEIASALGDHRYDGRLNDYSYGAVQEAIAFYRSYRDTLRQHEVAELSTGHMIDHDILRQLIEIHLFDLEELREYEWNPLTYTVGDGIFKIVTRESEPLEQRMRSVGARMRAIPAVLDAARENLGTTPAMHTQTAILQNDGSIAMLRSTLQPFIDSLAAPQRDSLLAARDDAIRALRDYGSWLRGPLMARARGDFRLGKALYTKKFQLRLDTDMQPEELLAAAERQLERTIDIMHTTALSLYVNFYPDLELPRNREEVIRVVLNRLAEESLSDSTIVVEAEHALRECIDFVRKRDLVTIPQDRLKIIVMPEYRRGVAVAYCDAPGPLETGGQTLFAIAPTPRDWTEERRASFYREYNRHMLKNLTVHEAMPGHFLQLATAKRCEAPTGIRNLFPSGVFAEGWATYIEEVMADGGFGGPEMKMQQLKIYLRLLINAIIDQRIHTMGMRQSEGLALMAGKGFQELSEAEGKWRRACLTSVQLSTYFYGNQRIRELRSRYEEKMGKDFNLKTFHDELLSYGTISPKYHPMLMKLPVRMPDTLSAPAAVRQPS
ncbi:MAG: DUF885 domain-containing protein [Ignavibacteria bacterium]|nr:MAG: DUF885 domain-containing protein [Ignavibacteria bacterium]